MNLSVGDRVVIGTDKAFVRYIGKVDGVRGDWVGVEWDDPSRGKHDGTVKDTRYFTTAHPMGGSLIRPSLVSTGVSLQTAVSLRYGSDFNPDDLTLGTKRVEMIGLDKGRQKVLSALRVIVLDNMTVSHSSKEELSPLYNRCLEMNLYGNLLRNWKDVLDCVHHAPNCQELVLGANFLDAIPNGASILDSLPQHESLLRLTLNRCKVDDGTISRALVFFPNVEELYAASNGLPSFGLAHRLPSSLTLIDLEDNAITSFEDIKALAELPNLCKLSLARCELCCLRLPSAESFPKCHTLNLKGNQISDWESIGQLRLLRNLTTLYIDCHKFHAEFGMDPREVIIAKLEALKNLERCELSVVERRSAEIRYLNKYSSLPEERKMAENHSEDLRRLEKEHGAPVMDDVKAKQMSIVKVVFAKDDKLLAERQLPTTLTVQKVLDMAKKLFRLGRETEIAATLDQNGFLIDLAHVLRPIAFYEPQNGDVIRIRSL